MEDNELIVTEGTVQSVIFQNPENGYTVLRLRPDRDESFTAVGALPGVTVGRSCVSTAAGPPTPPLDSSSRRSTPRGTCRRGAPPYTTTLPPAR